MARTKNTQQTDEQAPNRVEVVSKFDRFVDLVKDVEITHPPTTVEMHPWLQAQVDAGLVILC